MLNRYLGMEGIWYVKKIPRSKFLPLSHIGMYKTQLVHLTAILNGTLYYHIPSIRNGVAA